MSPAKGIFFKLISAIMFAAMSALVRDLGPVAPVGQMVFFRSAFAIVPVVLIYAVRGELMSAVRTNRPFGQLGRGTLSTFGMFTNFAALTRLPLAGVVVMLIPQFDVGHYAAIGATAAAVGSLLAVASSICNAGTVIQTRRLTQSETTPSIVFYFSLICAIAGALTLPFAWHAPTAGEYAALIAMGFIGGVAHIFLTESYRHASASVVAPFDYTAMLWALIIGYWMFGELPAPLVYVGGLIVAGAGLFVIWRER